jgi:hypothetical protein
MDIKSFLTLLYVRDIMLKYKQYQLNAKIT